MYGEKSYIIIPSDHNMTYVEFVKWMRRNFGDRGTGWDFSGSEFSQKIYVRIWDTKIQVMYEMWYT